MRAVHGGPPHARAAAPTVRTRYDRGMDPRRALPSVDRLLREVPELPRGAATRAARGLVAAVRAGVETEASGETLDAATRREEGLQLALRTRDGVPADALDADELPGLVELHGDRLTLTRRGRLLANAVSLRLR